MTILLIGKLSDIVHGQFLLQIYLVNKSVTIALDLLLENFANDHTKKQRNKLDWMNFRSIGTRRNFDSIHEGAPQMQWKYSDCRTQLWSRSCNEVSNKDSLGNLVSNRLTSVKLLLLCEDHLIYCNHPLVVIWSLSTRLIPSFVSILLWRSLRCSQMRREMQFCLSVTQATLTWHLSFLYKLSISKAQVPLVSVPWVTLEKRVFLNIHKALQYLLIIVCEHRIHWFIMSFTSIIIIILIIIMIINLWLKEYPHSNKAWNTIFLEHFIHQSLSFRNHRSNDRYAGTQRSMLSLVWFWCQPVSLI